MTNERTPGETLIDLYARIARIHSLSVENVAGPTSVMKQVVEDYGIEDGSINELAAAELAEIGRQGLHAYFAKEDQWQAEERLQHSEALAIDTLRVFILSNNKADMRVTQIVDSDVPMISINGRFKPATTAVGRLSMQSVTYPYNILSFHRRLSLKRHDFGVSHAEVFRGMSLKPRVAVEFL